MPGFKPMLAAKARPDKLQFPLYVQPKLDGIRCCIVGGKALTRTLKEVPNREIFAALSRPEFEGLDGELIVGPPTAEDCYRQTSSYVMAEDKTGGDWCFYVFDDFTRAGGFEDSIFATSVRLVKSADLLMLHQMRLVPSYDAQNAAALERIEEELIVQGHEGIILRSPSARYKFGRGSVTAGDLLKLKRFEDFEAEVIGVYEEQHNANVAVKNALGRTERSTAAAGKIGKGRLGGLILRGITDYEGVMFRCGTGFDAVMRTAYWNMDGIIGRTAKIKHFPIGAKDKPRFPTFIGWRSNLDL